MRYCVGTIMLLVVLACGTRHCRGGAIAGRLLLEGDSAKPLAKIVVVLELFNEKYMAYTDVIKEMQTGDDGRFGFSDLQKGKYQVRFASRRFRRGGDLDKYFAPPMRDLLIDDQNMSYTRDISVQVGVTIRGRVVDDTNKPIKGVLIAPHLDFTSGNLSTKSDQNGNYILTGIRPEAECELLYGIFGGCDYGRTQTLPKEQMKPGSEIKIPDIMFEKKTGKPDLIGIVFDKDGVPVVSMKALTLKSSDPTISGAIIAIKGKFALELPTGKYTICLNRQQGFKPLIEVNVIKGQEAKVEVHLP